MNRKILLGTLAAILLAAACLPFLRSQQQTRTQFLMDTVVSITAPRSAKAAVDDCFAELARLDGMLSAYRADSEVSRVNVGASAAPVAVSDELFALLSRAQDISAQTDGAFDVTIKPLIDVWDIRSGKNVVPNAAQIAAARDQVGYRHMALDADAKTVQFTKPGMQIELGGIAKGYAGDRVREILQTAGVRGAIADLGGNIVTLPSKSGKPYRIGLQDPSRPRGSYFTTVEPAGGSVVTSGPYERQFVVDGTVYHHILDPATGYPARTGLQSVTVLSDDGTLADALSTALFVLGADKGAELARQLGVQAIFLTDENQMIQVDDIGAIAP